jgi:hypothetical protein
MIRSNCYSGVTGGHRDNNISPYGSTSCKGLRRNALHAAGEVPMPGPMHIPGAIAQPNRFPVTRDDNLTDDRTPAGNAGARVTGGRTLPSLPSCFLGRPCKRKAIQILSVATESRSIKSKIFPIGRAPPSSDLKSSWRCSGRLGLAAIPTIFRCRTRQPSNEYRCPGGEGLGQFSLLPRRAPPQQCARPNTRPSIATRLPP